MDGNPLILKPESFISEAWLFRIKILVACQAVIGCIIFHSLSSYNRKHKKQMESARKSAGSTSGSLFELPAFRGKTIGNPFENTRWSMTTYEQFRLSIVAVTLFPLRFVGFISSILGASLVAAVLMSIGDQMSRKRYKKMSICFNRLARFTVSVAGRIVLFCFGYLWISTKGRRAKQGVGVLVSNHCSFLDGLVWVTFTNARPVAEEANFAHPIMKVFADCIEAVLFSRTDKKDRQAAMTAIMNGAIEAHDGTKGPILVFPTGTTANMQTLITFKVGAFIPGLPVQLGVLHYTFENCDPAWVSAGPGTLMLIFRMMCQWYNTLTIEFLDVHSPTEEEKKDVEAFARAVQLKVAEAMKATVTAHTVEDCLLQMSAMKLHMPASVGVVGFSALKEVFSVDMSTVKQQLHVFKELDKSNDGTITFEEFKDGFAKAFHDTSENQTKLLHSFFLQLTGGNSHLDFRKFLIGLALVNENQKDAGEKASDSPEASTSLDPEIFSNQNSIYAKMAFAAFAKEKDDVISLQEFKELWTWLHPMGINQEMAQVLGIPGPQERSASKRKWFRSMSMRSSKTNGSGNSDGSPVRQESPDGSPVRQESPPIANEDTAVTAGKVFALLSGGAKEEQVTWSQFEAYAKKNPIFIKDLRQSFFSRLAQEVPAKDGQKTGD